MLSLLTLDASMAWLLFHDRMSSFMPWSTGAAGTT
jgi:hypothetical protein